MEQTLIDEINKKCPEDQGIFYQPYGVPVHIKEHVVYMRWNSGGYSGGSCWNDDEPYYYEGDEEPSFKVLELTLKGLLPNLELLTANDICNLIHTNSETEYEYYGNSTDYKIKYIILSELEKLIEGLKSCQSQ